MRWRLLSDSPRSFLLVYDMDDEARDVLAAFADEQRLTMGHFKALGAFRETTIAWWSWEDKQYHEIPVNEQVEVVSMVGNVSRSPDGEPRVHAHVALGRRDGSLIGGHLVRGIVRPTLELVIEESSAGVIRKKDDATGLELIDLGV